VAVLLALLPMPRSLRYRLRLAHPGAARRADRIAGAALPVLLTAIAAVLVAAVWPRTPPPLRLWSVGAAVGLVTGIPFALERRTLRRRVVLIAPLADPPAPPPGRPPTDPPTPEELGAGALTAARAGRSRDARLQALRAAQLDASRWDVLVDTGSALCLRGRFAEGVRLLERAAEVSGRAPAALRALAAGDAVAGRLREAVAAAEEADRVSGPRTR
jgi:hypothetical protein